MRLNWRERLTQDTSLSDIRSWPMIDIDTLPVHHRRGYIDNRTMAAKIISGAPVNKVAEAFGVHRSKLTRLMNRCLAGSPDSTPALSKGLVPFSHLTKHQRRTSLPMLTKVRGSQNAFQYVLDHVPGMRDKLDTLIVERVKDKPTAQVTSPAMFFGEFKRLLKEANWPTDQYPYTTVSCGYEAVRRHYHKRLQQLRLEHLKKPSRIITAPKPIYRALKSIQIDTQIVDMNATIHLELNDELIPLRISRVALLKAIDMATNCVMGYHLALTKDPDQDDLLQLIDHMVRPWKPLDLQTPGLQYFPGSGFPTMWGDEFLHLTFDEVKLDNALMHLAATVREQVCDRHAATLNLGLPGVPLGRNFVEAAFRKLNQTVHRFPSTTGSHPYDPIRESRKNQKRPPKVTLRSLEETLSVIIATHNATPRAELNNETPLDAVRRHANQHYLRWRPERHDQYWSPFEAEQQCRVIFLTTEKRLPFIRFARLRYQGSCLNNPHLLHKSIRIRYNRRDIRRVKAYALDGKYLGDLVAPKSWQRFAHSVSTRKRIFKTMKEWRHHADDPLAEYFHHLITQKEIPTTALEIVRVARESTRFIPFCPSDNTIHNRHIEKGDENKNCDVDPKNTEQDKKNRRKKNRKVKLDEWHSSWVNKEKE